jgi:uncharacterized cupin superfamily protein
VVAGVGRLVEELLGLAAAKFNFVALKDGGEVGVRWWHPCVDCWVYVHDSGG